MKIWQINTVYGQGSTGKIVRDLHDLCAASGISCKAAHRQANGMEAADTLAISSRWDSRWHGVLARYTMYKGCFSYWKTRRFLNKVAADPPDVIHLHNLHGSYIHIGLLMRYIKRYHIPVVFTLHDCWAFTAICSHFTMAGCGKWRQGCGNCPQRRKFSASPMDLTAGVWKLKRKWFTGVERLTVVAPSAWLADLAKQSFLREYPVQVIHNGIDLTVFQPTDSAFREKYGLEHCRIVLGVAYAWDESKGLDVFVALAQRLPETYRVVLVGTDDAVDALLPSNVVSIHRTQDQRALAQLYTAADVLANPTREEALGMVNLEALACGTPVVTFKAGGSPECIDASCGAVVELDDVDGLEREIIRICSERPYSAEACIRRAQWFDKNACMQAYIQLYRRMAR